MIYKAQATAEAGRSGRAFSDDGRLDLKLSTPASLGGDDGPGTNPEQIFAAGYAACFHSALLFLGRQEKLDLRGSTVSAAVGLDRTEAGGFALDVGLTIYLPGVEPTAAATLAEKAHAVCPYSNALRGNVPVKLTVLAKDAAEKSP